MRNTIAAILAATFFYVSFHSPPGQAAAQEAHAALYGALPTVTEAQLSPDGRYIAVLRNKGDTSAVVFYDVDDLAAPPVGVSVGDADARSIRWANNDKLLLLLSSSDKVATTSGLQTLEFFRWVAVSRSTQKSASLFGNESGYYLPSAGSFLTVRPDDPDKAIFARSTPRAGIDQRNTARTRLKQDSGFGYSLFEVNLNNGRRRLIAAGNEDTMNWLVDAQGAPLVRVDYDRGQEKRKYFIRREGGSTYKLLAEFEQKRGRGSPLSLHGLSADPDTALATTYGDRDKRSLVEFDLRTGEIGAMVFSNPRYDIDAVVYEPRTARVSGVLYTDDLPRAHHLDEAYRKLQANLAKALPGAAPLIVSKSDDGARMIVEAVYTDHPSQFFLFDKQARRLDMFAAVYQSLDGKTVAKKEGYDYTSSDGVAIPGYLTMPANAESGDKKAMPLIVLPHGGPEGRDDQAFDWWSFFYAANGYLVYQPNFRGSDGYGFRFRAMGYGEWGRKMQDDVTEGVRKLIADGLADPERICIVGASYGGYAALAGATLTPDLYACAVSVNGVSNLAGMLGREAQTSELASDYWQVRIGSRFRDGPALDAVSPLKIADRAGPPILLIHGKDDVVVPVGQSLGMRNALRDAGKPHEYVELKGEDHWLSTSAARTEMLQRSIAFIDRYIGG